MTWQPGKQTNAINILRNISRYRINQTMEFGHLVEYNIRNIYLNRSYTKCGGNTIPKVFSKNSNLIKPFFLHDQKTKAKI